MTCWCSASPRGADMRSSWGGEPQTWRPGVDQAAAEPRTCRPGVDQAAAEPRICRLAGALCSAALVSCAPRTAPVRQEADLASWQAVGQALEQERATRPREPWAAA